MQKKRFDLTTIGEGQLRLCVKAGHRLEEVREFEAHVSGSEGNVAGLLSRLGWDCSWVSSLPDSPLGNRIKNEYKLTGLDMGAVSWSKKHRLATYFVEYGLPPRSTQVYYDRKETCFTNMQVADIDWDYLLDTNLLHLSGLTLPLSESVQDILLLAVKRAKEKGVRVSFDMNYRTRLWSPEEAKEVVTPLLNSIDILFCCKRDAKTIFGFDGSPREVVDQLRDICPAQHIVSTLAADGVIGWDDGNYHHVPSRVERILDRIGAGDAMVAGVLHGYLQNDFWKGLEYGQICSALALTQYGDQVITTKDEVEALINSKCLDIVR